MIGAVDGPSANADATLKARAFASRHTEAKPTTTHARRTTAPINGVAVTPDLAEVRASVSTAVTAVVVMNRISYSQ
jgi:hypothetical protein